MWGTVGFETDHGCEEVMTTTTETTITETAPTSAEVAAALADIALEITINKHGNYRCQIGDVVVMAWQQTPWESGSRGWYRADAFLPVGHRSEPDGKILSVGHAPDYRDAIVSALRFADHFSARALELLAYLPPEGDDS
jgi:hypothetical protein